ncbi:MAG TPA: hypothetical protein DDX29_11195 [Clostridiales bacterium]|nr:hypothetical protein [Clostridiales bacterium]
MAFIWKVKTTSGATGVQIAYKQKGKIVKIIHMGSAHTEEELHILLDLARKHLQENQLELFPELFWFTVKWKSGNRVIVHK